MTKRLRISIALLILALSAYQGLLVFSPVAIPKPSESQLWWVVSSAMATSFWFLVFMPAWLPATVPPTLPRLSAALLAICGALLIGASCLLILYGALLPLPNHFLGYGLLALGVGIFFLYTLIRRGRYSAPGGTDVSHSQNEA